MLIKKEVYMVTYIVLSIFPITVKFHCVLLISTVKRNKHSTTSSDTSGVI